MEYLKNNYKKIRTLIGEKYFSFKLFDTKSLIEAGCTLMEVQEKENGRKVFVFKNDEGLKKTLQKIHPEILYI